MKILMPITQILDFGGIIQDLVWKYKGLTELGHDVDICLLRPTDKDPYIRTTTKLESAYPAPWADKYPGAQVDTISGLYGIPVISYGSVERLEKWRKRCSKYDMLLYELPFPNPNSPDPGAPKPVKDFVRKYWKRLYTPGKDVPLVLSVHDCRFVDGYPHISQVADYITGMSTTTVAGYKMLREHMPTNLAFIPPPHPDISDTWEDMTPWEDRKPYSMNASVWKAWKRNDLLVRAAPHLTKSQFLSFGDGIECRYMRSKEKCPDQFKGIWKAAEQSGNFRWFGLVTEDRVYKAYQKSRLKVDLSYASKYHALEGSHWNRAIWTAANNGVPSLCVTENMIEKDVQKQIVKEGVTHWEISAAAGPRAIAEAIDHYTHVHPDDANQLVHNCRKRIKKYMSPQFSSQQYINLAEGKPSGFYPKLERGELSEEIQENAVAFLNGSTKMRPQNTKGFKKIVADLDG